MFDWIYNIINYPIIEEETFIFSPLNVLVFFLIYLSAKVFLKYAKRSFKILSLTDKQLTFEGKNIAIWKLTRQITYVATFILCVFSLRINNEQIDTSAILGYELIHIENKKFHIAIYHIFLIIFIFFVARLMISIIRVYMHRAFGKNDKIDQGTAYVYIQLAKYLIYSIAVLITFRSFGADVDLFVGVLTVVGVGFALGAQHILKDYMSGFLLLFERSIKVGDVIEVQKFNGQANLVASVEQINLRTSKVKTTFDKILIIPNSQLTHESVVNWSLGKKVARFSILVTVSYGSDTEKVKTILMECARNHPRVAKSKDVIVWLKNFGSDGLEMELTFWATQTFAIEQHKSDIRFAIDHEFRKEGITIPFPQRDVHVIDKVAEKKGFV